MVCNLEFQVNEEINCLLIGSSIFKINMESDLPEIISDQSMHCIMNLWLCCLPPAFP